MKHKFLYVSIGILIACSQLGFSPKQQSADKPKNVILLIGDGMGLSQISYALVTATDRMNFERFKIVGLSRTEASDHKITDSAAGATALSCGKKTYNGAIAVDDDKRPIKTILEIAEENGLSTGMVATCAITHATPASFIAHQPSRNMSEEIAADFLKTDIDLFIGGGLNHFTKRTDGRDLTKELKSNGYTVVTDQQSLWSSGQSEKIAGLINPKHLESIQNGRGDYLPKATQFAIDHLSKSKKGFFLMVEGSQIDWGGHANDAEYIRQELMDFDKALAVALVFAEKDGNTLVIVTADHETGGFALSGNEDDKTQSEIVPSFTTKNHTGTMVPVFAYGPGAEAFGGIYENTAIFEKMKNFFGF